MAGSSYETKACDVCSRMNHPPDPGGPPNFGIPIYDYANT